MSNKTLAKSSPGLLNYLKAKLSQEEISELEIIYNNLAETNDLEELQMPLRESDDFNPRAARLLNILFTDYELASIQTFKLALLSCQASKINPDIQELINFEEGMIVPEHSDLIAVALARLLDNLRHLHLQDKNQRNITLLEAQFLSLKLLFNQTSKFSKLLLKAESSLKAQMKRIS